MGLTCQRPPTQSICCPSSLLNTCVCDTRSNLHFRTATKRSAGTMGESSSSGYIGTGLRDLRPLESPLKVIPYRHVLPTSPHTSHSPPPSDDAIPVVERQRQKASPLLKALAGSMGGLVEAIALQTVDTIKTRMQILPTSYPSMIKTAQKIASEESVPALWKGLTPFATHLFSKYALRFGTNAAFQSILTDSETGKGNEGKGGRRYGEKRATPINKSFHSGRQSCMMVT